MAKFKISLNMEFCRSPDKSFEAGVRIASELGYRRTEPMVHTGWELLSEVNYFHSFSMEEDPLPMKEICDRYGVKVSNLSAHSPWMKPGEAVDRLTRTAVLASLVGCDFLNSDEMIKPDWMDDAFAHDTMRDPLARVAQVCARHRKFLCIEPHGISTQTTDGLLEIVNLVRVIFLSVECGKIDEAQRGISHLNTALAKWLP